MDVAKLALRLFDLAELTQDLPAFGLSAGAIGTVVEIYRDGEGYEVEFMDADGWTIGVETLLADQLRPASPSSNRRRK